MLCMVYSKGIDGTDNQRERAKLDAAFVHDLRTARRTDSTTDIADQFWRRERELHCPAKGYETQGIPPPLPPASGYNCDRSWAATIAGEASGLGKVLDTWLPCKVGY